MLTGVRGFKALAIVGAQTLFHDTERYRYITEVWRYLCRGYMIVNKYRPVYTGTVYKRQEDAEKGLNDLKDWLIRIGQEKRANELIIAPHDFTETVCKKRHYKL